MRQTRMLIVSNCDVNTQPVPLRTTIDNEQKLMRRDCQYA